MLKTPHPIKAGDQCRIRLADDRVFQGYVFADDGAAFRFSPTRYGCHFSLAKNDLEYIRIDNDVHYLRYDMPIDWSPFYMRILESGIVKRKC